MKEFIVTWHANGCCGSFRCLVIANNLNEAKDIFKEFVSNNDELLYWWKEAERGVRNHTGGFISWKEVGESDKDICCYELDFDRWCSDSDHLSD